MIDETNINYNAVSVGGGEGLLSAEVYNAVAGSILKRCSFCNKTF